MNPSILQQFCSTELSVLHTLTPSCKATSAPLCLESPFPRGVLHVLHLQDTERVLKVNPSYRQNLFTTVFSKGASLVGQMVKNPPAMQETLPHSKVNQLWVAGAQSRLTLCVPWPVAHQAPLFMGFSRQEYWNRLSFPPPGDLPDSGIEPASLVSPALAGGFFTIAPPGKPLNQLYIYTYIPALLDPTLPILPL